jgi:hypothetical protein
VEMVVFPSCEKAEARRAFEKEISASLKVDI